MLKLKKKIILYRDVWSDGEGVYDHAGKFLRQKPDCDCLGCFSAEECFYQKYNFGDKYKIFLHENFIEIFSVNEYRIIKLINIYTGMEHVFADKYLRYILEFENEFYNIFQMSITEVNAYHVFADALISRWDFFKREFYDYGDYQISDFSDSIIIQPGKLIQLIFLIFRRRIPKLIIVKIIEFMLKVQFEQKIKGLKL